MSEIWLRETERRDCKDFKAGIMTHEEAKATCKVEDCGRFEECFPEEMKELVPETGEADYLFDDL